MTLSDEYVYSYRLVIAAASAHNGISTLVFRIYKDKFVVLVLGFSVYTCI